MREVMLAAYALIVIGFLRNLYAKIVPDGRKHTLWFNLPHYKISIRMLTTENRAALERIRRDMGKEEWNLDLLTMDERKYRPVWLYDPELVTIYSHDHLETLQLIVETSTLPEESK